MNNKIILLVFAVFLMGFIFASDVQSLPPQEQWKEVNLIQGCVNSSYSNISRVTYPNSTFALNTETIMNKSGNDYNYTFSDTGTIGKYLVYGHCDEDGVDTVWAYDFDVNPTGTDSNLWLYIIFFVFGAGLIVFGFKIEDNWIVVLGGFVGTLLGLYILFFGLVGFKETVYTQGMAVIVLFTGGYFSIRGAWEALFA